MSSEKTPPTAPEVPTLKLGDTLKFGRFQGRPLTWMVLDYKDDHWLVMTTRGITCRPYNDTLTPMTWEESALRAWLNGTFLERSFSGTELAFVLRGFRPRSTRNMSFMRGRTPWIGSSF